MYKGKYSQQQEAAEKVEQTEKKKLLRKPRVSTIVFYSIYVLLIVAFFVGINALLSPLEDWLIRYEASQPEQKCQEIFTSLFTDPDWEQLYTIAGIEDTTYEDSKTFAAYMEKLSAGKAFTYVETSAGLSGDHKYIIKLDGKKIGTFTLTGGADSQAEIPQWELGKVEFNLTRTESVQIEKLPGYTVYINGVALDDSYTVRKISTGADKYLPEGLHGFRYEIQSISGLLVAPEVTVSDQNGNSVPLTYDEESNLYAIPRVTMEMTENEQAYVKNTLETFAKYMIKAASLTQLKNCCVPNAAVYTTISKIDRWMQDYLKYEISPITYSNFYRYSDTLFSVRAAMTNSVTRKDGSVKDYEMDYTLFFSLGSNGKWLLSDMTQVDISEKIEQVRLTFIDGDAILDSIFVDADTKTLTLPAVTVPEGKVFSGWVRQEEDSNGKTTLTIMFQPDESNTINLPDTKLEPMTLYTLFVKGEA